MGFHVEPLDLEVAIEYSEHFVPDGNSCDDAGAPATTTSAVAPTWVTLIACTAGEGYARLVASGHVIEEVSVTVTEPAAVIGQAPARPSMSLAGVPWKLTIGRGSGSFSIRISGLDSSETYELHAVSLNLRLAFNSGCTNHNKSNTFSPTGSTYRKSYNLWGCRTPGGYLWAYMDAASGGSYATELTDHYVTVVKAPTPVPPTPTPVPATPDKVTGLSAGPGRNHGTIALTWNAADRATGYQVGQRRRQSGTLFAWEVLSSSEVTIDVSNTRAVVHGLTPGFSYEHSVQAVRVVGSDTFLGPWADGKTAKAHDDSPEVPTGLMVAHMVGNRGISLSWTAATGAQDYEVEISTSRGVATTIAPGLSIDYTGLVPGTTYSFRVRSLKPTAAATCSPVGLAR